MHLKSQGATQKCLMLGNKEEDMCWTTCKESLVILSHQTLMVKIEREMMVKTGCMELKSTFNFIITHLT